MLNFLVALVIVALIILARIYFLPWWNSYYEKKTLSYKTAVDFIYKNQKIKEYLGEIKEITSIPHADSNIEVITYIFDIIGEKQKSTLTIKMAADIEWFVYLATLEIDYEDVVVYMQ